MIFNEGETTMKIATYNIWNSIAGMPFRFSQIINEIMALDSDIICLQEVADIETHTRLATLCNYKYTHFHTQTGLAVLSKYPIAEVCDYQYATAVKVTYLGKTLFISNVHLPWDSALKQEKAIVSIMDKIGNSQADYALLMGDFNCSDNSSVHRFLKNEQSLLEHDAYFYDLAEAFAEMTGTKPSATLNFRENPRWGVAQAPNTIEVNQRFDRIMLKNPYPSELPTLKDCGLFGTAISEETHLAASDHYGVYIEMTF